MDSIEPKLYKKILEISAKEKNVDVSNDIL
jgi:hypothetical protein